MGKASRRKRPAAAGPADSIHVRIAEEAAAVRAAPVTELRAAEDTPALAELLEAAWCAVEASLPRQFIFHGKPYWLRTSRMMAKLEIFDGPAKGGPLFAGVQVSSDEAGHVPGH